MENQDNLTPEQVAEIEALPLHEAAGKILGKEFPDVASAAKALKDTFGYVGKAGEALKVVESVMTQKGFKTPKEAVDFISESIKEKKEVTPPTPPANDAPKIDLKDFVSRAEFDKQTFYASHPELNGHEKLVETFAKANPDKTRNEILALDEFKEAFEPMKAAKQKSILHSKPNIAVAGTKIDEAKEAVKAGNQDQAAKKATEAVMDAFEL